MKDDHMPTEIFIKAYRSLLRSEGEIEINQFINLFQEMHPLLHEKAGSTEIDFPAFTYSFLRLPPCMQKVKKIYLAQTDDIFRREGIKIEFWKEVAAPARRRKTFFDGKNTLGMFINSVSDVDDLVCLLISFQIEWNKLHFQIKNKKISVNKKNLESIKKQLDIKDEDWIRLQKIWNDKFDFWWQMIADFALDIRVKLLRGSYVDYEKAAQKWFENIVNKTRYQDFVNRPLYFVSSNTHSLVNIITGWVNQHEKKLIDYLYEKKDHKLLYYWKGINTGQHPGSKENFLWYVLKKYEKDHPEIKKQRLTYEQSLGIDYIEANHFLDVDAQLINLKEIPRINKNLSSSDALILNIDYPLGFGAYMVLTTILRNINNLKGIYILSKASFLNGKIGDIGLPTTVFNEHSKNMYFIKNPFNKEYFPDFKSGNILTQQKVVSVKGTYLQSKDNTLKYLQKGYTIIEMEDGPYLDAVYNLSNYDRYPEEEVVNLINSPVDIGIIHYASDTPFTKAITLGTRNLGYEGVEATYTSSLAIIRRIIEKETGKL